MNKDTHRPDSTAIRVVSLLILMMLTAPASAQLLWSDEFDSGTAPDPSAWSYDLGDGGWGNSEMQTYTDSPANVRIENGALVIEVQEEILKGKRRNYTSARIKTENKLTVKYGTIEAAIKVPNLADGLWPAFWTLGNDFATSGWPACGELDIMEMGSAGAIADGVVNRRVGSTAHWEHNDGYAGYGLTLDAASDLNDGEFHVFRMDWTPTLVSTYLDNELIWEIDISSSSCTDCSEFHQPHFLLLNVAVGGSYTGIYNSRDLTVPLPAELHVDYVRVYGNEWTELGGSFFPGTRMHVESIDLGTAGRRKRTRAAAFVVVQDENGGPVAGAEVSGTFSGSHSEAVTATTDSDGIAELVTSVFNQDVAFTFCVDSVSHAELEYDPGANQVECAGL
jgi:beta-glucanase (GH16 family)